MIQNRLGLCAILAIACATVTSLPACSSDSSGGAAPADGGGSDATASGDAGIPTDAAPGTDAQSAVDGATPTDAAPSDDTGVAHAEPPPAGAAMAADGSMDITFAISKFYLGDTDPDGTPDKANGWQQYGYDLDGKVSTASSTDLCKPRNNAQPKNVYPDGIDGRDNSFGKLILPIILGISSDAPSKVNAALAQGTGATMLFSLQKLNTGAAYNPLVTGQYNSLALGAAPKYDGTDIFPVDPTTLQGTDITMPKTVYTAAYLTGNTWVSGPLQGAIGVVVPGLFGNAQLQMSMITMELSADHKHVTRGVIAGILDITALENAIRLEAGSFDPTLCSGSTIDSIVAQIDQAADIMADGSQDPTKQCTGISIGVGFDAEVVQLGAVGAAPTMPANPCADAGP